MLFNERSILITKDNVSLLKNPEGGISDKEPLFARTGIIPFDTFHKSMKQLMSPYSDEMLPDNCKFITTLNERNRTFLAVVQQDPCIRTINVDSGSLLLDKNSGVMYNYLEKSGKLKEYDIDFDSHCTRRHNFTLAFPYVIFIVIYSINDESNEYQLNNFKVYFKRLPLVSMHDELKSTCLPNVHKSGSVCFDRDFHKNHFFNLRNFINGTVDSYWASLFNDDLLHNMNIYAQTTNELSDFYTWEYNTKLDPRFVLSFQFLPSKEYSCTLQQIIKEESENHISKNEDSNNINSRLFSSIYARTISNPIVSNIVKSGESLLDNVSFGKYEFEIGDSLQIKGKNLFIDTITWKKGKCVIVNLSDQNGKKYKIKKTTRFCNWLERKLDDEREIIISLEDGTAIKKNDLVLFKNSLSSVRSIRKARDGNIEVSLNTNNFILDYIAPHLKPFDLSKIKIGGTYLKNGERYYILKSRSLKIKSLEKSTPVTYERVIVRDNPGSSYPIVLKFNDPTSTRDDKSLSIFANPDLSLAKNYEIIDQNEFDNKITTQLPCICVQRHLYLPSNSTLKLHDDLLIIDDTSNFDNFLNNYRYLDSDNPISNKTLEDALISNGEFNVYDISMKKINFKIGDNVIIADYIDYHAETSNVRNIRSILKIWKIIGFSVNAHNLYFQLQDENGKIIQYLYVIGVNRNSIKIHNGNIRKVVSEYDGIIAGKNIMATVSGIPMFKKSDINKIVAIVNDCTYNEPLVLMSNCCTLPVSSIKSSFKYTDKEVTQTKLDIPLQPGDIVLAPYRRNTNELSIVFKRYGKNSASVDTQYSSAYYRKRNTWNYSTYSSISYESSMFGLPNPRIAIKDHIILQKDFAKYQSNLDDGITFDLYNGLVKMKVYNDLN